MGGLPAVGVLTRELLAMGWGAEAPPQNQGSLRSLSCHLPAEGPREPLVPSLLSPLPCRGAAVGSLAVVQRCSEGSICPVYLPGWICEPLLFLPICVNLLVHLREMIFINY